MINKNLKVGSSSRERDNGTSTNFSHQFFIKKFPFLLEFKLFLHNLGNFILSYSMVLKFEVLNRIGDHDNSCVAILDITKNYSQPNAVDAVSITVNFIID